MKVEKDALLTCAVCEVEGPHGLRYLSHHLCASRCINCGTARVYSEHIYSEYARDLAGRTTHLPGRMVGDVFRHPTEIVKWPFKAIRKPFGLLREVNQVTVFEQSRNRTPTPGRRIR